MSIKSECRANATTSFFGRFNGNISSSRTTPLDKAKAGVSRNYNGSQYLNSNYIIIIVNILLRLND